MKISLSPMRRDDTIDIVKYGDVLTINGESFDFSSLPDGATIIAGAIPCEWISGHVERIGGVIHLTIILPHGPNAPESVLFPLPISDPPDGEIILPGVLEVDHVDA